jgi:hypothetical protein
MPNKSPPAAGIVITGSTINTGGGDIVGRDKVQSIATARLNDLFEPVNQLIATASPELQAEANVTLRALKAEIEKGATANDSIVAKLIDGLVALVPSAVAAVVSAFTSPVLAGIAGPATKYVIDKISGK